MAFPTTNLGPLTETFTPPSDCSQLRINTRSNNGGYDADWGRSCKALGLEGETRVFWAAESCYPGNYGSYINSGDGAFVSTQAVFSPGSVCPFGYEPACTIERHEGDPPPKTEFLTTAEWAIWNRLKYDQTAIGCCPSGYTCADDDTLRCTSDATVGNVIKGNSYGLRCLPTPTTITVESTQSRPIASGHRLFLIQGTGRPVPETATPSPSPSSGGTSSTAKRVATVAGSAACVILFAFCVACCIRRRNRPSPGRILGPPRVGSVGGVTGGAGPASQGLMADQTGVDNDGEAPPSYEEAIQLNTRPKVQQQAEAAGSSSTGSAAH